MRIFGKEYDTTKAADLDAIGEIISDAQNRAAPNDLALMANVLLIEIIETRHRDAREHAGRIVAEHAKYLPGVMDHMSYVVRFEGVAYHAADTDELAGKLANHLMDNGS